MNFFRNFPLTTYKFGDDTEEVTIENIAIYADVIDQIQDATTAYQDYYIQNGQRPDQVALELYDTPEYMFTLLLVNPKLRELGWPLSNNDVYERALKDFTHTIITTRTVLTNKMAVGQTITGLSSGATAKIAHRVLDYGQIWIESSEGTFINGETITSVADTNEFQTIVCHSVQAQYQVAHHYENADGDWVDIDPTVGPGAQITPITYLQNYENANNDLRSIRVIKPAIIEDVVRAFFEAIK